MEYKDMLIFLLSLLYCYQKEIENFEYERYKNAIVRSQSV
jgi:hypothetical protein